jgi:cytochrome c55X
MVTSAPRLLLLAAVLAGTAAAAGEPSADRQQTLIYRLRQDCGSCHGMTLKGGLGPSLLPGALANKPDDVLVEVIVNGLPGTPMPPWGFELSRGEAAWLVQRMKEGLDETRSN